MALNPSQPQSAFGPEWLLVNDQPAVDQILKNVKVSGHYNSLMVREAGSGAYYAVYAADHRNHPFLDSLHITHKEPEAVDTEFHKVYDRGDYPGDAPVSGHPISTQPPVAAEASPAKPVYIVDGPPVAPAPEPEKKKGIFGL